MPARTARVASKKPRLLSGGNPQIPKGEGDEPVQAYIAAMPGWKRGVGRRLDGLVTRTVPGVRKAVKWNSPLNAGSRRFSDFAATTMKKNTSSSKQPQPGPAARRIDARIAALGDWRGETLERIRALVHEADPGIVEEWKWAKATSPGTPVWSHDGIVCTGETYKNAVKMTFAKGASLDDPSGLFNASLEGRTRRAIDFQEGDRIDGKALKALVRAAVALNTASGRRKR